MTKLFFFFNVNLIPYIHGHFFDSLQSLSEVFYIIQSCEVDLKFFPYNIISYFLCPNDMEWLGKVYLLLLFGTFQRNCELQLETFPQALCNQPDYIFSEIREEREGKVMWKSFFFIKWSEVAQLCPTLCDPMDCSLPGSSIHGILQARILAWVAISFSRGSSPPRDRTWVSRIVGRRFTVWATREVFSS